MEFDWLDAPFKLDDLKPREIEESFEDPFSLRLLPDDSPQGAQARYFSLGRSIGGTPIFSVFWTDGKNYRVIAARRMTPEEATYYDRKNAEANT